MLFGGSVPRYHSYPPPPLLNFELWSFAWSSDKRTLADESVVVKNAVHRTLYFLPEMAPSQPISMVTLRSRDPARQFQQTKKGKSMSRLAV